MASFLYNKFFLPIKSSVFPFKYMDSDTTYSLVTLFMRGDIPWLLSGFTTKHEISHMSMSLNPIGIKSLNSPDPAYSGKSERQFRDIGTAFHFKQNE